MIEHNTSDLEDDFQEERHGEGLSLWVVVLLLLTAAAVLYIVMDGADDAVYAYTVDQAVEKQESLEGKRFRVRGLVQDGTIESKPGTLDTRFKLIHNGKLIAIAYDKPLPDTFKAGVEVMAQGKLESGVLIAEEVVAKCPSKYEDKAPTADGKMSHPEWIPKGIEGEAPKQPPSPVPQ